MQTFFNTRVYRTHKNYCSHKNLGMLCTWYISKDLCFLYLQVHSVAVPIRSNSPGLGSNSAKNRQRQPRWWVHKNLYKFTQKRETPSAMKYLKDGPARYNGRLAAFFSPLFCLVSRERRRFRNDDKRPTRSEAAGQKILIPSACAPEVTDRGR